MLASLYRMANAWLPSIGEEAALLRPFALVARRRLATLVALAACIGLLGLKANAAESSKNATSFTVSTDTVLTINRDETFEKLVTIRIKVLGEAAISAVGQQSLPYFQD